MSAGCNGSDFVEDRPAANSRAPMLAKLREFFQAETSRCNKLRNNANEFPNSDGSLQEELNEDDQTISEMWKTVQQIQAIQNEEEADLEAENDRLETMTENCNWISETLDENATVTTYAEEIIREKTNANSNFLQDFRRFAEEESQTENEAQAICEDRAQLHTQLEGLEKMMNESIDQLAAKDTEVNEINSDLCQEVGYLQSHYTELQNLQKSLEEAMRTNKHLEAENSEQEHTAETMKEDLIREQEALNEEEQLEKDVSKNASEVQVEFEEYVNQRDSCLQQRNHLAQELEGVNEQRHAAKIQVQEFQQKLAELTTAEQQKQEQLSELDAELNAIQGETQRAKHSEEVARQNMMDLKTETDLQNDRLAEKLNVLAELEDQLKDLVQTAEIQGDSVKQMEQATRQLQDHLEGMKLQYETIQYDLTAETDTSQSLNEEVSRLGHSLAELVNEIENNIKVEEAQERESVALSDRRTLLEDKLSDHDNLQQTKNALENELSDTRERLELAISAFDQLTDRKLVMQCETEDLERELQFCLEAKEVKFKDFSVEHEEVRHRLDVSTELKRRTSDSITDMSSKEREKLVHIESLESNLQNISSELSDKRSLVQARKDGIRCEDQKYDEKKISLQRAISEKEARIIELSEAKRVSYESVQLGEQPEQCSLQLVTAEESEEEEKLLMAQSELQDLTWEVQQGEKDLKQKQLEDTERLNEMETNSSSSQKIIALNVDLAELRLDMQELNESFGEQSRCLSAEESKHEKLKKEIAKVEKKTKTSASHHSEKDLRSIQDYTQHEENEIRDLLKETKTLQEMKCSSLGSEERLMKTKLAKIRSEVAEYETEIRSLTKDWAAAEQERQKITVFCQNLDGLKKQGQELDNQLSNIFPVLSAKSRECEVLQQKHKEMKLRIEALIQKREHSESLKSKQMHTAKQSKVGKKVGFYGLDRSSPDIIYGTPDTEMETSQAPLASILKVTGSKKIFK